MVNASREAPIDLCVSVMAQLQCVRRVPAQHLEKQSALELRYQSLVLAQIGYRPDGLGDDGKSIGISKVGARLQNAHHFHANCHPG